MRYNIANRNLGISRAPLKSQAHQGNSLFITSSHLRLFRKSGTTDRIAARDS